MNTASSTATLLFAIAALALVLALAWLLLKGLAAMGRRSEKQSSIHIKSSLPLGSRERLVVIEYRGSDYLLGVASGHLSLIDKHPGQTPVSQQTPDNT